MSGPDACGCVVGALVEMAPDPATEPGRYFVCRPHEQMIVWDGLRWRWSNQPEDIAELPRMADEKKAEALRR